MSVDDQLAVVEPQDECSPISEQPRYVELPSNPPRHAERPLRIDAVAMSGDAPSPPDRPGVVYAALAVARNPKKTSREGSSPSVDLAPDVNNASPCSADKSSVQPPKAADSGLTKTNSAPPLPPRKPKKSIGGRSVKTQTIGRPCLNRSRESLRGKPWRSSSSSPSSGVKLLKFTPRKDVGRRCAEETRRLSDRTHQSSSGQVVVFDGEIKVAVDPDVASEQSYVGNVAFEFPERINTQRAGDIFWWCVCNPFSWLALLFSNWSEKLWLKSTRKGEEDKRGSHRLASRWWGAWSVDCGLLAFAFNFLTAAVFLTVLWVWLLNLWGVSFKLVAKWGRGPDAETGEVKMVALDEFNF